MGIGAAHPNICRLEIECLRKVQSTAISRWFRCSAPLQTPPAFFYIDYRDSVAFNLSYLVGLIDKKQVSHLFNTCNVSLTITKYSAKKFYF